jgi:streptogramin lyase
MWFTGGSENPYIYKVTTSGVETPYLTHAISGPSEAYDSYAIVEGPDGNMWFTEGDRIGVITTSGTVTEYMLNGYNRPQTLVVGPDGRLWFDNWQSVGAITTSGTITYYPLKAGEYFASGVAFASDGNLHFFASVPGTNSGVGLRTMTMSGVETTITTGIPGNNSGNNYSIVEGPDGNLWGTFTGYPTLAANGVTLTAELADETAAGVVQEFYVVPNSAAAFGSYLTVAPDHSMWTGWQNTITHVLYNP